MRATAVAAVQAGRRARGERTSNARAMASAICVYSLTSGDLRCAFSAHHHHRRARADLKRVPRQKNKKTKSTKRTSQRKMTSFDKRKTWFEGSLDKKYDRISYEFIICDRSCSRTRTRARARERARVKTGSAPVFRLARAPARPPTLVRRARRPTQIASLLRQNARERGA